jgi:hypothetical protein
MMNLRKNMSQIFFGELPHRVYIVKVKKLLDKISNFIIGIVLLIILLFTIPFWLNIGHRVMP